MIPIGPILLKGISFFLSTFVRVFGQLTHIWTKSHRLLVESPIKAEIMLCMEWAIRLRALVKHMFWPGSKSLGPNVWKERTKSTFFNSNLFPPTNVIKVMVRSIDLKFRIKTYLSISDMANHIRFESNIYRAIIVLISDMPVDLRCRDQVIHISTSHWGLDINFVESYVFLVYYVEITAIN